MSRIVFTNMLKQETNGNLTKGPTAFGITWIQFTESKLAQHQKVFLCGVLVGLISLFMLWTIIFTTLSSDVKLIIFVACAVLAVAIQVYALRKLKKSDSWNNYNWSDFQQDIRNYRWFGIFLFGAVSPYLLSSFIYVVLKNL